MLSHIGDESRPLLSKVAEERLASSWSRIADVVREFQNYGASSASPYEKVTSTPKNLATLAAMKTISRGADFMVKKYDPLTEEGLFGSPQNETDEERMKRELLGE